MKYTFFKVLAASDADADEEGDGQSRSSSQVSVFSCFSLLFSMSYTKLLSYTSSKSVLENEFWKLFMYLNYLHGIFLVSLNCCS